jgi:hypothetical protein
MTITTILIFPITNYKITRLQISMGSSASAWRTDPFSQSTSGSVPTLSVRGTGIPRTPGSRLYPFLRRNMSRCASEDTDFATARDDAHELHSKENERCSAYEVDQFFSLSVVHLEHHPSD